MGEKGIAEPVHSVTLSDFSIGKYPVTQKLWQEVMGSNPSHFKGDDLPVEKVSWDDVQDFLKKLNAKFPGHGFRLPTEAEWEFAARGGALSKGYQYAGSDDLQEVGWFWENSGDKPLSSEWKADLVQKNNCRTHPVGQKKANELGLYDMSGNVWEWCADWYGDYAAEAQKNPEGPKTGTYRVIRGGSWGGTARTCRVAFRNRVAPEYRDDDLGFRLVSSPQ
jgi:formylglycine-generating enzyme required for sulfatase activity